MKESKEGVTRMRKWPVLDIQTLSLPFLCLHHQPWCKLAIIPFNVPSIHRPARLSSSPLPPPPPLTDLDHGHPQDGVHDGHDTCVGHASTCAGLGGKA